VCFVMSYVKSDLAGGPVYLWSPVPASVDRVYHKILGVVKRSAPTPTSWGRSAVYEIAEQTACKAAYQFP
jgi:hypothetical protein